MVEGQVIARSTVEFETRLSLLEKGAMSAAVDPLPADARHAGLQSVIDRWLLVKEGERLQLEAPSDEVVAARVGRLRMKFPSAERFEAFLSLHEVDREGLGAALRRMGISELVLESKLRGRTRVEPAELRRARLQRPDVAGMDDGRLAALLERERARSLVAFELARLRSHAKVKVFQGVAEPDGGEGGRN